MSQALQTDIRILSLLGGRRSSHAPTARAIEPADGIAPAEGKGNLYILLELDGPEQGRAKLYRELLNTIQETYYYHREDVATALTAALRAAHAYVQQYNQYHHYHFRGGATCLVATGEGIVSAQVGPTILAVNSGAGLQWFSPLNNDKYVPMGDSSTPAVEIGRVAGHPGIVIVAMTSAWANYLEVPLMMEATAVPNAQAVVDQLAGIGIGAPEELVLLTVTFTETDGRVQVKTAPRSAPPSREIAVEPEAEFEQQPDVWGDHRDGGIVGETESEEGRGFNLKGIGSALGGFARGVIPDREEQAPAQRRRQRQSKQGAASPRRIPFALGIIAILLIAAAAITAGMWYLQGRQREQNFLAYMDGARIQYDAAIATDNENQARLYLQAAIEQLNDAELFSPGHLEIEEMRNLIAEMEAIVNHVQPLLAGFDSPLITFEALGRQPARVFVNGLSVYVMDSEAGTLTRYQMDTAGDRLAAGEAAEVLIRRGDTVGGRKVGELADALWASAEGNRTATGPLVFDRSNQLFGMTEGLGAINVDLAENPSLGFVTRVYPYIGRLYMLDTTASQLWRYRPTGDSFENEAEPYFSGETSVNLSTAIDIAIDGDVWLLYPNGTLHKYTDGLQEAFALDSVVPPLGDAVALWVNEAEVLGGRLYIADGASNRILVFDKSGTLLSQLMPADHPGVLNNLRSIFVDEAAGYLYALTDTALYQAPLPPIAEAG